MKTARLKLKEERRLLRGHPWAYRNEFAELPELADGDVVDVVSDSGRLVGRGFYQAQGGIAVRVVTRQPRPLDAALMRERIGAARSYRETCFPGETTYRWIFGESDGLPGLVADRYGSVVVVETACAFYAGQTSNLATSFMASPGVQGVYFRVCGAVQRHGDVPERFAFSLNGLEFELDLEHAQKTGMFLDQRSNCRAVEPFARGARVLDGHCYAGLWSLHGARAGAAQVLGVDTSANATAAAQRNAERNGFAAVCRFECADVREVLNGGARYDIVILDPPALAKSRSQTVRALRLYQALNRAAMTATEPGGYLITSSCSHFVDSAVFLEMLKKAAAAVQRDLWVIEVRGAAPDHPALLGMPETTYLTCVVARVL